MGRCSRLIMFFFKEKFCVKPCVGKSLAKCLLFEAFRRPCRKNYISGYIWHKSFIQTVKCTFFSQRIIYQSFYGALLTFNYIFLQGKVPCLAMRRQVACELFIVWSFPKTLLKKWYFRFYLTQTVHSNSKMLFLTKELFIEVSVSRRSRLVIFFFKKKLCVCLCMQNLHCLKRSASSIWHKSIIQRIVYQSFYGALPTFTYFYFNEKFCISPGTCRSKCVHCRFSGKISFLLINIQSVKYSAKCKTLFQPSLVSLKQSLLF